MNFLDLVNLPVHPPIFTSHLPFCHFDFGRIVFVLGATIRELHSRLQCFVVRWGAFLREDSPTSVPLSRRSHQRDERIHLSFCILSYSFGLKINHLRIFTIKAVETCRLNGILRRMLCRKGFPRILKILKVWIKFQFGDREPLTTECVVDLGGLFYPFLDKENHSPFAHEFSFIHQVLM